MNDISMGTEVTATAEAGSFTTFEEVVHAFCQRQAELRARLARSGEPRGGDPREALEPPPGAHQGHS